MTCKLDKALLQDLLENVIDPVEKIFVEEHLKTCRECRRELKEWKLLFWDLNDSTNHEVALPAELDRIKDSLQALIANEQPSRNTAALVWNIQRQNVKVSSQFLEHVPGIQTGNKLFKESVKAMPATIGKLSRGLVKSTKLLLAK